MKLAFSTNAFTRFSLFEAMEVIKKVGYDGVEIMADKPHCWPLDLTREEQRKIKEKAHDLDLTLCNVNGFMMRAVGDIHHPSWIETHPKARQKRRDHTLACLRIAHAIGAPWVSTEPGGPLEGMEKEKAMDRFAEGLKEVMPLSLSLGIKLLLEPEPGLLFSDVEDTLEFFQRYELSDLGINFDLGHLYCMGFDPAVLIRKYSPYLLHLHIEDIAPTRIHHHLIPGHGAMDFPSIFQTLHEVNYKGFITVELYPYEEEPLKAAEEAFDYLSPFLTDG